MSACHHTFHQHCIAEYLDEQKYHMEQFRKRQKDKAKVQKSKADSSRKRKQGKGSKKKHVSKEGKDLFYTSCPVCYQPLTLTTVRGATQTQKASEIDKHSDLNDEDHCVICCERKRNALLLDCGHMFTCTDCFTEMHKDVGKSKWLCPICRGRVRKVVAVSEGSNGIDNVALQGNKVSGDEINRAANLGRETILQVS